MSTQDKVKMYDEAVREHKLACQRLRQAEEKMLALRKAMLSDIQMVRRGQPNSRRFTLTYNGRVFKTEPQGVNHRNMMRVYDENKRVVGNWMTMGEIKDSILRGSF